MTNVQIQECKKTAELYCQYDGQTEPQGVYIALDCETGYVYASYNGEIGNAVPISVWNNRILRWPIPLLTGDGANDLMRELLPLFQEVVNGYSCAYNGQNYVGRYTEDADNAKWEIERQCSNAGDNHELLMVIDADEWYQNSELDGLNADMTVDELNAVIEAELEAVDYSDYHIVEGLEQYIRDRYVEMCEAKEVSK